MLHALNLTKRYPSSAAGTAERLALDAPNLTIAPGEIFCLLGQNGAGKTTTINLFLGFLRPTSGQALIDGLNVADHRLETKKGWPTCLREGQVPFACSIIPSFS